MYNFVLFMKYSKSLVLFKSLQRTHTRSSVRLQTEFIIYFYKKVRSSVLILFRLVKRIIFPS